MHEHFSERQSEQDCEYRLLRQYVERGCQAAFGQIVSRYSGLVYSTCLRQVREPALAEDAAQSVFLLLAMKAPGLPPGTVLSGWLYRTACFVVRDLRKQEARRRAREEAMAQQQRIQDSHQAHAREDETWDCIAPLLDDALASLGDQDQTAVVLRFFEGRSLRETGAALGVSEAAAQMRVVRSLEKLRRFFARRGVTVAGLLLASLLTTRAVQAAPLGCTASVLQALTRQAEWIGMPGGSSPEMPPLGGMKSRFGRRGTPWTAITAALLVIGLTVGLSRSQLPTRPALSPKAAVRVKTNLPTVAPMLTGVYICRICRCFYSPARAKAMGYAEGRGPLAHHLVYASKPPVGYTNEENLPSTPAPNKG